MNKKTRFYEVTLTDGHGSSMEVLAGFSAKNLESECRETHVAAKAKPIHSWKEVTVLPSDCGQEVVFRAVHNDEEIEISPSTRSYEYLKQRYLAQYTAVEQFINEGG